MSLSEAFIVRLVKTRSLSAAFQLSLSIALHCIVVCICSYCVVSEKMMIFIRIVQLNAFQALLTLTSANVFRSYLILSKFCPNWFACVRVLVCLALLLVAQVLHCVLARGEGDECDQWESLGRPPFYEKRGSCRENRHPCTDSPLASCVCLLLCLCVDLVVCLFMCVCGGGHLK